MADMKLKNCPYCDGEPSLIPHIRNKTYEVRCLSDKCYEGCALDTIDEAVKHWNTRASDSTIEAQEAEIKRLRESLGEVINVPKEYQGKEWYQALNKAVDIAQAALWGFKHESLDRISNEAKQALAADEDVKINIYFEE